MMACLLTIAAYFIDFFGGRGYVMEESHFQGNKAIL